LHGIHTPLITIGSGVIVHDKDPLRIKISTVGFILIVNTAFSYWLPIGHHNQIDRMTKELIELKAENNKQFLHLVRLRAEIAEINNEAIVYKELIKEVVASCN